jgi:hypothetical protein
LTGEEQVYENPGLPDYYCRPTTLNRQTREREDATMAAPPAPETPTTARSIDPIVVDMGKKSRKQIKNLKRGKGRLVDDVAAVVDEVKANWGSNSAGKEFVPVVIVYRKKSKRGRGSWLPML